MLAFVVISVPSTWFQGDQHAIRDAAGWGHPPHQFSWYNNERLHGANGHRPPREVKEAFHGQANTLEKAA